MLTVFTHAIAISCSSSCLMHPESMGNLNQETQCLPRNIYFACDGTCLHTAKTFKGTNSMLCSAYRMKCIDKCCKKHPIHFMAKVPFEREIIVYGWLGSVIVADENR